MIVGMKPLQRRLAALSQTRPVMRQIQIEAVAGAKARVHRRTGFLARSIVPGDLGDGFAVIEVNAPYAAAEELGSRPHVIVPKRASRLAWPAAEGDRRLSGRARKGTSSGDMVFAKKVNHPGTKPHPYAVPAAVEAIGRNLKDGIIKLWNDAG